MDQGRIEAFLGAFVGDLGGAVTMTMVQLGDELGLYRALDGAGPVSAGVLARRTATNERLVREWLDQQAAAGYVEYDADADAYALPDEHAMALSRTEMPTFVAKGTRVSGSMVHDIGRLADAFRADGAVDWSDHHVSLFDGVAEFFRPGYEAHIAADWIPALDGIEERLEAGGTIADVGCGFGVTSVVMAQAYPKATVHGFDPHQPSLDAATERATAAGVADRVSFEPKRATAYEGTFDLVCLFDALHDMGDPVGAARHAREHLAPGGSVLVVEPMAADDRAANHALPSAKVYYGASTFICTPSSLAQDGARGMGAQAGEAATRAVFEEAGFSGFRRVAETPFNLIYEARV